MTGIEAEGMQASEAIDRPLATFTVFAYNQEAYVAEAVRGALAQQYRPLQVILSAILANTQGFKKKPEDANVAKFAQNLQAQGWQKVDKSQSRPGDVVIINGSQHTELVTKAGGTEAIGSNGGATNQKISTDGLSGGGKQEFYQKR